MPETKFEKRPVVYVALPVYGGQTLAETAGCIEQLTRIMDSHGWGVYTHRVSMADIEDSRNCVLTRWYDKYPDSDYLLMIDNDMIFDWKMVISMFALNKPVVGCIYSRKDIVEPDENGEVNFWKVTVGDPMPDQKKMPIVDGFQQWNYVGGGVLLIRRDAVRAILEKFPEINDTTDPGFLMKTGVTRVIGAFNKLIDDNGMHLSEDFAFCHRHRKCGGEVWAAVGWTVGHRGLFTYNFNAVDMLGLTGEPGKLPQEKREAA